MFTTLISSHELADNLANPNWVILDCRFVLLNPGQAEHDYIVAHIPGAVYLHLDRDLSGPIVPGQTGRHPLPAVEKAAAVFSASGIGSQTQVVAYDAAGGALAAVRAWWMLRWLGHSAVAVLDGGWQAWQASGFPQSSGIETNSPAEFVPHIQPDWVVTTNQVDIWRQDPDYRVCDSRTADRYRGENEIIDPVAGHIPGAISVPYPENLTPQGFFLSPEQLRQRFARLLDGVSADHSVFYCGSGVSAIHNILALQHAGLGQARLYAGSWSEWITDPSRPVALGNP